MQDVKVVFLDDEENVLKAIKRILHREDFKVVTSNSPYEVLHLVTQDPVAVVVSDYKMPLMTGTSVLGKVKELSPNTIRILLTAYADVKTTMEAINEGGVYKLLTKPWDDTDLRLTIRQAVSQYNLVTETLLIKEIQSLDNKKLSSKGGASDELKQMVALRMLEHRQTLYQLNKDLYANQMATIARIAKMHNKLVWLHSERVHQLCRAMGEILEFSSDNQFQLEMGALFHDVGKVGIASEVLIKPRHTLTEQETTLLKSHSFQGEALLQSVEILETAALFVRFHHENFDGTGYPNQLSGEDIPLGARVITIADAYDNASHGRPIYIDRNIKSPMVMIEHLSGSMFDPRLVPVLKQAVGIVQEKEKTISQAVTSDDEEEALVYSDESSNIITKTKGKEMVLTSSDLLRSAKPKPPKKEEEVAPVDKGETETILVKDLQIGMVLAEDLLNPYHVKLLQKDTRIEKEHLEHLRRYIARDIFFEDMSAEIYLTGTEAK